MTQVRLSSERIYFIIQFKSHLFSLSFVVEMHNDSYTRPALNGGMEYYLRQVKKFQQASLPKLSHSIRLSEWMRLMGCHVHGDAVLDGEIV